MNILLITDGSIAAREVPSGLPQLLVDPIQVGLEPCIPIIPNIGGRILGVTIVSPHDLAFVDIFPTSPIDSRRLRGHVRDVLIVISWLNRLVISRLAITDR
jgi:hypothetical protein